MEKIRTVCQACHCECGVLVSVDQGRAVKIEGDPGHPMNKGATCIKGRSYLETQYHPDRLKYPLKRAGRRGEGKWQRVSWEQALSEIASQITSLKDRSGPQAFASIHGTGPRSSFVATHLMTNAMRSPNVVSVDCHICYEPSVIAEKATMGESVMIEHGPDYPSANCIVVWGGNPETSHPPLGQQVLRAKKERGAKLIVIDPRRTRVAGLADLWLQIRPGTDGALALAMINTLISEKLYNMEFVNRWCLGFEQLKNRAAEYPPERAAEITWVPADTIRQAARMYATTRPATLHHRVAVEHNINSTQACRALSILLALTGNVDVEGGNLLRVQTPGYIGRGALFGNDKRFRMDDASEWKRIGSRQYPLLSGPEALGFPFVVAPLWIDNLASEEPYPIKAMYCAGGNPVVNCQDSRRVWDLLQKLDLFVVADFFMTPTAEAADYVLPVKTWLERDECCDLLYNNYIAARQKVVETPFEALDDLEIAIGLVQRLPWADRSFLPWKTVAEHNEWAMKGTGVGFDEFKKRGYIVQPMRYKKYETGRFQTPSGKIELSSSIFQRHGYDPLPGYREPAESPYSTPELSVDYPLVLTTGARHIEYFHSEGRQIPSLRKRVPDPEMEVHPETAAQYGIRDGDWVWIETPKAKGQRIRMKAIVTDGIDPRVVHARHGWWFPERPAPEHGCFDSNVNAVLTNGPREEICCSVATRGTLCRIYK